MKCHKTGSYSHYLKAPRGTKDATRNFVGTNTKSCKDQRRPIPINSHLVDKDLQQTNLIIAIEGNGTYTKHTTIGAPHHTNHLGTTKVEIKKHKERYKIPSINKTNQMGSTIDMRGGHEWTYDTSYITTINQRKNPNINEGIGCWEDNETIPMSSIETNPIQANITTQEEKGTNEPEPNPKLRVHEAIGLEGNPQVSKTIQATHTQPMIAKPRNDPETSNDDLHDLTLHQAKKTELAHKVLNDPSHMDTKGIINESKATLSSHDMGAKNKLCAQYGRGNSTKRTIAHNKTHQKIDRKLLNRERIDIAMSNHPQGRSWRGRNRAYFEYTQGRRRAHFNHNQTHQHRDTKHLQRYGTKTLASNHRQQQRRDGDRRNQELTNLAKYTKRLGHNTSIPGTIGQDQDTQCEPSWIISILAIFMSHVILHLVLKRAT